MRKTRKRKKKKKNQPPVVELTPEEKALRLKQKLEQEKLEREEKFKQHVEDRKLKIIKKFWHDSLVCRAQPEEILNVNPICCNNSRQALSIDIYGAKAIVSQMKIKTINELYNAYCDVCKKSATEQFHFTQKLENALSSKRKAMEVIGILEIIQNREAMDNWIKPGEDGPKTKAQEFMDFKILTLKRNKAKQARLADEKAKKAAKMASLKKRVKHVAKSTGKLSLGFGLALKKTREDRRSKEFEPQAVEDIGSLDEILKPTKDIQTRARTAELNFSNYEQKLFHMAQIHRPKARKERGKGIKQLEKLRPWTVHDKPPPSLLHNTTATTMGTAATKTNKTGNRFKKHSNVQSMPNLKPRPSSTGLAHNSLSNNLHTQSLAKLPHNDTNKSTNSNGILSPNAWPASDNTNIGSPPVSLSRSNSSPLQPASKDAQTNSLNFLPKRQTKLNTTVSYNSNGLDITTKIYDNDDYVNWYLENDIESAIPDSIDKDLYNIASFQRVKDEDDALKKHKLYKHQQRPNTTNGSNLYLNGYVSQGQRFQILKTIVAASKSNKVGIGYLEKCQELKLPLPEAMVRLMSRNARQPRAHTSVSNVRLQPVSHPHNKAASFMPYNEVVFDENAIVNLVSMAYIHTLHLHIIHFCV
jgi:hypothetical protein